MTAELAALKAAQQGMVSVPVEPTEKQIQAGMKQWDSPTRHQIRSTYYAMLAASQRKEGT